MNLYAKSCELCHWIRQVVLQFFRVAWGTTFAVIVYSVIARVTRMLAFLLPLKVILLAGSNGVPRYFGFFISPDLKSEWIVALSAAAVVSYALTLFLEAHAKRLSERGGADLLAASGVMSVVAGQREQMQGFYARVTGIAAAMLFAIVALATLVALDPMLAFFLGGLLCVFYLLTAWVLHEVTPLKRTRISNFITEDLGSYLGVLSSVAFLSSFLVILYPFIAGTNGSILFAIVAFVLVRQLLAALSSSVRNIVSLARQKPLIDALVFPDHRFQISERRGHRTLRELFGREDRERLFAAELGDLARPGQRLRVEWRDPLLRGAADFAVTLEGAEAPARHFRARVFPPQLRHMVENEELLFSHVAREAVWAPPLVGRFVHGEHECLVWDAGTGRAPAGTQWRAVEADVLANLWSYEPPPGLLKIYASSHNFLHQRLTDEFVGRIDIGIDTDAQAAALKRLRDALPAIRDTLAALPLRLVNPDFWRETAVATPEGGFNVLGWERWSLEPIGGEGAIKLPAEDRLAAILDLARTRRPAAIPDVVNIQHLLLARRCALLEQAILRGTMKAALALARQVTADRASWERMSAPTGP